MRLVLLGLVVGLLACDRPGASSASVAPASPGDVQPPATPPDALAPREFCWNNAPQGAWLNAIWANANDDAWAVGSPAVALHWNGAGWTRTDLPTHEPIRSVWSSSRDDVWLLAGDGAVLRGDGVRFEATLPAGPARGWIRGLGPLDVWAGDYHWDGQQWTRHALPQDASPSRGVRVVPLGGGEAFGLHWPVLDDPFANCAHFDGAAWREQSCPGPSEHPQGDIAFVPWSSGNGDLLVAGVALGPSPNPDAEGSTFVGQWLARWDGSGWSYDGLPTTTVPTAPLLTGTGPGDLWFGAPSHHLQGSTWTAISPPGSFASDAAAVPGGVFVLTTGRRTLAGAQVLGGPASKVAFGDGAQWRELLDLGPEILIAGQIGGRRVGVAADGVAEFDGNHWVTVTRAQAPFTSLDLNSRLFGEAPDDFWVVRYADSSAYHWDGARWSVLAYPGEGRFWSAGSAARGRAWFVGEESSTVAGVSLQRFRLFVSADGTTLAPVTELGEDDVWGVQAFESGETLAFATRRIGEGFRQWSRVLWRHDGTRWTEVWSDAPNEERGWSPLAGVTQPDDVWAFANAPSVGDGFIQRDLLHWDGATMARVARLRGVEGSVAAVVQRGEVWFSAGVEHSEAASTAFRRARVERVDTDPVAVLPATARQLWSTPEGRVFALSDLAAEWEARASCR